MHEVGPLVEEARAAFGRRDWVTARKAFSAARARDTLTGDDLFGLAEAAWWLGSLDEALTAYQEAYRAYLDTAQPRLAAMAALAIGYTSSLRGETAVGSGWMSRALRLLQDQPESAEHGYLVYVDAELALGQGDLDTALARARQVQAMGHRFAEPNLVALGVVCEGRALTKQGQVREGMALLDEAMLAALSDELDPSWAGNIYCHLMVACHELADLRRASEWTQATAHWCERLPGAGPFMGICRVHRSQVLQVQGAWEQAEREAARVCEELARFHVAGVAEGFYQLGEIRRLRGDLSGAEEAFTRAHQLGHDPQPGLALLRLAQGRVDAALASIQAALTAEPQDRLVRARLCVAEVEIALAARDMEAARIASDELTETARLYASSGLEAAALQARGAVLVAAGHATEALTVLRAACQLWRELNAPYEAARVRLLLTQAFRALADQDAAELELAAAEAEFARLGAQRELGTVADLRGRSARPGGLTDREAEVLALVAKGKTNREIARVLVISEKTVARHLENIFAKLDLSSRTAAAAYAYEHGLAASRRG